MKESTRTSAGVQPKNIKREPVHVSVPAMDVVVRCARESFTAEQLRNLAAAFDQLAADKEAKRGL